MKRLVSAKDVVAAAARHEDIYVDENTIVTAQARHARRARLTTPRSSATRSTSHTRARVPSPP